MRLINYRFKNSLEKCYSIADLRSLAQQRIPRVMFDYIDGAAEDEVSLQRNNQGFNRYEFIPNTLVDVSQVDLTITIQDIKIDLPIIFAPTGSSRLFHHEGEYAVAAAAAKAGTIYTLSSMSSRNIEDVSACSIGPKWFQIYVWKDRAVVKEFIQRCKDSGYQALCLTVDAATPGQRERDLRNGFTIPPRFTLSALIDMGLHPKWWWHMLNGDPVTLANVVDKAGIGVNSVVSLGQYVNDQLDPSVTWEDMAWMIKEWGGPFMIKGILAPDDAKRAVELGASGVIISNHGGRQLDHAVAPIDVLPDIVAAVGGKTEIILDGGIRRGTDIIKALALGANACMIGRPYLYGLAAGGQAGVERAIELLHAEVQRGLRLLGCQDIKTLGKNHIRKRE